MGVTEFPALGGWRGQQTASIPIAPSGVGDIHRAQRITRWISDPDLAWRSGRYSRIVLLLVLTLIPFWGIYRGIAVLIAGGSPIAYVSVVPVLAAMIAFGYRSPPRGVGDAESDWILAAIFGGLGLFLRHLMSNRFPTLSGLWQLPLVGAVLWAACLAAVLFGVGSSRPGRYGPSYSPPPPRCHICCAPPRPGAVSSLRPRSPA